MAQGNLPQRGYNNSDEPVREFFDTYYQNNLDSISTPGNDDQIILKDRPGNEEFYTAVQGGYYLNKLEQIIADRKNADPSSSYVASLFAKGINKIAQKVGEEAVELVIEAKDNNEQLFLDESADLLFHYLILLQSKGYQLDDVVKVLAQRHKP